MQTEPLAVIDWSRWESLELIPLTVLADGNPLTPDAYRPGFLFARQVQAYSFLLEPDVVYEFHVNFERAQVGQAFLSVGNTGELLWANTTALQSLGLDPGLSSRTVVTNQALEVTLGLSNVRSLTNTAFDIYVNAEPPVNENVYRFVKLSTGQYFYTASEAERELIASDPSYQDFRFEGAVFSGDASPRTGYVPVYRFADISTGGYFYTANEEERASIEATKADSMRFENIAFYVPEVAEAGVTAPVIRLKNLDTGGYLFTANSAEVLYAQLMPDSRWEYQGVAFQALGVIPSEPQEQAQAFTAALAEADQQAVDAWTLIGMASDLPPDLVA